MNKEKLEALCKNWYSKDGTVEGLKIHHLIETIANVIPETDVLEDDEIYIALTNHLKERLANVKEWKAPRKLVSVWMSDNPHYPRLFAVVDEGKLLGFGFGAGYDPETGSWDQGYYNYYSQSKAIKAMVERYGNMHQIYFNAEAK